MTIQEYYGFPAGTKVKQKYLNPYESYWPDGVDLPSDLSLAYAGEARQIINQIPTSHVTDMTGMFKACTGLSEVSWFDTSSCNNMTEMFADCQSLKTIPAFDTSKVTTMYQMFNECTGLTSLPPMDCTNIEYNQYPIYGVSMCWELTDVGGFINMYSSWTDIYGLSRCPNLTYQSCLNILHGLYDFVSEGEEPDGEMTGVLKVNANFITTVGDYIAIAIDKGWNIIT